MNPLTPTRIIAFGDAFSTVDVNGFATYTVNTSSTDATVASRIATIYGLTLKLQTTATAVISSGTAYSYAVGTATASDTYTQIKDSYLVNNTCLLYTSPSPRD